MAIDIAGFVADLKNHAIEHGFHVHDERHFMETYSLRQSWEVDVHPEDACGGPLDLHLSLDVDPRVVLSLQDRLDEMDDEWEEPEDLYRLDLYFNWQLPSLKVPPDLLVVSTDLAGLGGVEVPITVSANETIESIASLTDPSMRTLLVVGKCQVSLVDVLMAREQLCDELDRAKAVSAYLLDRVTGWLESPN
ncbi:MAG: hypothetical protein ACR2NT_10485 [Acidimicrobiia bacterium]|nr:hypothetical protein [Acidimicrobiia bacterium]MDQ3500969.1 hypothetical protein [Actinomycetota bacterium]